MRGHRPFPPAPPGRFLTGHLGAVRRGRLQYYQECARDYGDVFAIRFVTRRIYVVSHPDLIEDVLVTHSRLYRKHFGLRLNPHVFGNGLLTSEGDFWLRQRRLIQPAFARPRLAELALEMVAAGQRLLARWSPGQTVDIEAEMMRLTMDITARALFGTDATADAEVVAAAITVLQETFARLFTRPLPPLLWLPTPTNRRMWRALRQLDAIIYRFIEERRKSAEHRNDLLTLLLRARDEGDGQGMSDKQVRDEAMTLFLAGHETTALALSWAWYLLANCPEVEARLVEEWRQVLGDRSPTPEDIPRLRQTEMVVHEVLRLYPPAPAFGREALEDTTLGDYQVPRGTTIVMSPWVVQRDPRWWQEPEVFRPERWALGHPPGVPKYAYFPFGGGPRLCIGNTFALMEATLLLPTIGRRYRFTIAPDQTIEPLFTFTLRPRYGIRALLQAR
jgi:cytochrome P450